MLTTVDLSRLGLEPGALLARLCRFHMKSRDFRRLLSALVAEPG